MMSTVSVGDDRKLLRFLLGLVNETVQCRHASHSNLFGEYLRWTEDDESWLREEV